MVHAKVWPFPTYDRKFRQAVADAISELGPTRATTIDKSYADDLEAALWARYPRTELVLYPDFWLPCIHAFRDGRVGSPATHDTTGHEDTLTVE